MTHAVPRQWTGILRCYELLELAFYSIQQCPHINHDPRSVAVFMQERVDPRGTKTMIESATLHRRCFGSPFVKRNDIRESRAVQTNCAGGESGLSGPTSYGRMQELGEVVNDARNGLSSFSTSAQHDALSVHRSRRV